MLTDVSAGSKDPRGDLLQAINTHVSHLSYLRRSIPQPILDKLYETLEWCSESTDISFSVHLGSRREFMALRKAHGLTTGVENYLVFSCDPSDEVALEEIGYFGEVFSLFATLLGLASSWVGVKGGRDESMAEDGEAEDEIVCAMPFGFPSSVSYRERLFSPLHKRKKTSVAEMSRVSGIAPDWFNKGVECAIKAPSLDAHDSIVFTCKGGEVTASYTGTGRYLGIDLGIAKLHFEIAANNAVAFQTTGVLGSRGKGRWEWGNGAPFTMHH